MTRILLIDQTIGLPSLDGFDPHGHLMNLSIEVVHTSDEHPDLTSIDTDGDIFLNDSEASDLAHPSFVINGRSMRLDRAKYAGAVIAFSRTDASKLTADRKSVV